MHIICPGWFGNDHGPVVIGHDPTGGAPSHGICPVCRAVIDSALAHREAMAREPMVIAKPVRNSPDVELAAATGVSVLITAGSEKTRREFARWIHARSLRRDGPFVVLGGDGATSARMVRAFARAGGGTLFVDALEQLLPWPQRQLLRLMDGDAARTERGAALRLVRVVAGGGPSLWDAVVAHHVSQRLFYRLNTIRIDASPSPQDAAMTTVRASMSSLP